MRTVSQTATFAAWFRGLRDLRAKAKVQARIDRAELGNFGDCAPVGEGVAEMRIHYGPGYRVYFTRRGEELVILLAGGDKGSQYRDIAIALDLARRLP
jgi:putative addiction module killer protein